MKKIHDVSLAIWSYTRISAYLVFVLLLGWILFNGTAQSRDFVAAFIVSKREWGYYVSVGVLLFCWSYLMWYSSSIILEISPDNFLYTDTMDNAPFSLVMGYTPCLILGFTFIVGHSLIFGSLFLLIGIPFILFFRWRDKLNDQPGKWPTIDEVKDHNTRDGKEFTPPVGEEIRFIRKYPNVFYYFAVFGVLYLVVLIIFCVPSWLVPLTRALRPAGILLLILTAFTYVFTLVSYFHNIKTRPFLLLILVWLVFMSLFNDNTEIQRLAAFRDNKDFRLSPGDAFKKWFDTKISRWRDSGHTGPMPVIFIATQGGGVRGEVWTIEVLQALCNAYPGFYDQVFCMGGASGGTVGALYYNAYMYDVRHMPGNDSLKFVNLQRFASADCLSPVTGAFAFGEGLQHFLPFRIPSLERSKIMMDAFNVSYRRQLNSARTDSSFLSMYYPNQNNSQFNCELPSLFINGTLAESGQRIITSDLKVADTGNFKYDIDFFGETHADISVATASLNCMRFPFLLSGGLFRNDKGFTRGHLVDGGYRENTGLQAMYSLMGTLRDSLCNKLDSIKPILLYIRNGSFEYKIPYDTVDNAIRLLHDLATPVDGLINVNGTSVPALGIMKMIEQQEANGNPLHMYYNQVWLGNPIYPVNAKDTFPLGLYISDSAYKRIQKRAAAISSVNKELTDTLQYFFKK